jgi:hypothetical protein
MDHTIQYPLGINRRDVVGLGITALVARLDAVIKFARRAELPLLEREKGIYERLGHDHDGVLRYYGNLGDALILQYACHGSIRQYYASQAKSVSLSLQLRWVEQITASVAFIHSRNVSSHLRCGRLISVMRQNSAGRTVRGRKTLSRQI